MENTVRVSVNKLGKFRIDTEGSIIWNVSELEAIQYIKQHNSQITNKDPSIVYWNTLRLDKININTIFDLYEKQDYSGIFKLHNSLKLSNTTYCCSQHKELVDLNVRKLKSELL